jgi:hypothetical protein
MKRKPFWLSRLKSEVFSLAATAILGFTSCSYVDQFGTRAVSYNIEAEHAKDQDLVLNIVRAAYRKPMQFTDLSTISGQATASFTGGLSLLFGPHQSASGDTATPSATFSGGPTFAVGTLNTKEFYEGILAPIPTSTIDYYLSQGFPKSVLFSLLIAEIDIDKPGGLPATYAQADTQRHWDDFRDFLNMLLDAGLSAETVPSVKAIGPPLTSDEARDPRRIAELKAQKLDLVEHSLDKPDANLSYADRAVLHEKRARVYYRIEQDDTSAQVCFQQGKTAVGRPIGTTGVILQKDWVCGEHKPDSSAPGHKSTGTYTLVSQTADSGGLSFKTRSVEGIIYLLGEIARSELHLGVQGNASFVPQLWAADCNGYRTLFSIGTGVAPGAISTTYDGVSYSVPVDSTGCNRSAQVLEVVTQLLALNSSAKDLPTPNIIPLITR